MYGMKRRTAHSLDNAPVTALASKQVAHFTDLHQGWQLKQWQKPCFRSDSSWCAFFAACFQSRFFSETGSETTCWSSVAAATCPSHAAPSGSHYSHLSLVYEFPAFHVSSSTDNSKSGASGSISISAVSTKNRYAGSSLSPWDSLLLCWLYKCWIL